jgi:hypothetical protein
MARLYALASGEPRGAPVKKTYIAGLSTTMVLNVLKRRGFHLRLQTLDYLNGVPHEKATFQRRTPRGRTTVTLWVLRDGSCKVTVYQSHLREVRMLWKVLGALS